MRYSSSFVVLFLSIVSLLSACADKKGETKSAAEVHKPDSQELYDSIVGQDSIFFAAYNTCDLGKQAAYYDDSIEFYHDKGGLMTSKQEIIEGTRKYICGKVTRELIKGSVEVYPIKGYGAIEMGLHQFHNNQEPNLAPHPSKFIFFWQHKNNEWKIKRVVSLH
jgi:Domain of unknown function (DUF4440)